MKSKPTNKSSKRTRASQQCGVVQQRVARPRAGSSIARMLKAYSRIISVLDPLTPESRIRVIRATSIILGNEV
jgi:hypothetical protein